MKTLTSRHNPLYKELTALKKDKGVMLLEGKRLVADALARGITPRMMAVTQGFLEDHSLSLSPDVVMPDKLFTGICETETPQGILAFFDVPWAGMEEIMEQGSVVILDGLQDPGNVGTLIRSAVAFGFSGVILTEKCADHLSPKCVQSSAGTVLSLWIRRTSRYMDLVESLKRSGYMLVSTDIEGSEDTSVLQHADKLLLALGNEASGLSRALLAASDHIVRIPMVQEKAESLNVGACGAICMYLSNL
ncbi:MAG: RNA methyltransferase [Desulfomonilia bacterium]